MASGKSTWSKAWVQEDEEHRVRISRDDLRKMLYGVEGTLLNWAQEQNVSAVEMAIARTALEKGKDVVVDAMHLRAQYIKRWFTLGYPVEYKDFWVELEDALARNRERGGHLPDEAIEKTYNRFCKAGVLPVPPKPESVAVEKYEADWNLPTAWIVDIDGTLASMGEGGRSPYDYSRVHEDELYADVAALVNRLEAEDHIIIVSGREGWGRPETEEGRLDNGIRYDETYMRKTGDQRQDAKVKAEIFDEHIRPHYNVLGVFDDRNQVVRAWRDMGLRVYQVADGAF
jgi:predicted kinase